MISPHEKCLNDLIKKKKKYPNADTRQEFQDMLDKYGDDFTWEQIDRFDELHPSFTKEKEEEINNLINKHKVNG